MTSTEGVSGNNPTAAAAPASGTPAQRGRITELPPLPARPAIPQPKDTYLGVSVRNLNENKDADRMLQVLVDAYKDPKTPVEYKEYIQKSLKESFDNIVIDPGTPKAIKELRMKIFSAIGQVDGRYKQELSQKAAQLIKDLRSFKLEDGDFNKPLSLSVDPQAADTVATAEQAKVIREALELTGRYKESLFGDNSPAALKDLQKEYKVENGRNGYRFGDQTRNALVAELVNFYGDI